METKQPKRRRNRIISVRMNDEEYSIIRQKIKESGLPQQAYIIAAIMNSTIKAPSSDEIEIQKESNSIFNNLTLQIRGMATNINQLARVANGQGNLPVVNALNQLAGEISKYRKETEKTWQLIRLLMDPKTPTEH